MNFEVTLYTEGEEQSKSNAPNRETAEKVVRWHVVKYERNTAKLVDRETGDTMFYTYEAGECLNRVTGEIVADPDAKPTEEPEPQQGASEAPQNEPEECESCREHLSKIDELEQLLQGEIRNRQGWILRYNELKADKEAEAKGTDEWKYAIEVFEFWKKQCNHKGQFSYDRFRLILPFLKKDGVELCKTAITGAAFDPYTTIRKNGTEKRHDSWELIFRDRGKFEEFTCRSEKYSKKKK